MSHVLTASRAEPIRTSASPSGCETTEYTGPLSGTATQVAAASRSPLTGGEQSRSCEHILDHGAAGSRAMTPDRATSAVREDDRAGACSTESDEIPDAEQDSAEIPVSTRGFVFLVGIAALVPCALSSLGEVDHGIADVLGFGLFLVLSRVFLLIAGLGLLANGVMVVRREGMRVATALAGVVGLGLLVLSMALRDMVEPGTDWLSTVAGAIVVLGAFLIAQLMGYTAYAVLYARRSRSVGGEVLVVLGCGLDGARVTPLLASRLDRAVRAYRAEVAAGADPIVITSGGRGPDESVPEADAMADYLVAQGVPADRIVRERESRTTEENLRYSATVARERGLLRDGRRMVVVTSDFHVLRAAMLSRRLGLRARVVGGRTARYFVLTAFLREFAAFLDLHRHTNIAVAALLILPAVVGSIAVLS
ncbi:YdcF family protein [Nocardia miyunensis]|uniref:YdcF family protein n=1 Tax=Nocardia miyunensis TaxID=282684 RepID=UPI000AD7AD19|nr:YdcF family protein [Nocardia miyunensis]